MRRARPPPHTRLQARAPRRMSPYRAPLTGDLRSFFVATGQGERVPRVLDALRVRVDGGGRVGGGAGLVADDPERKCGVAIDDRRGGRLTAGRRGSVACIGLLLPGVPLGELLRGRGQLLHLGRSRRLFTGAGGDERAPSRRVAAWPSPRVGARRRHAGGGDELRGRARKPKVRPSGAHSGGTGLRAVRVS